MEFDLSVSFVGGLLFFDVVQIGEFGVYFIGFLLLAEI